MNIQNFLKFQFHLNLLKLKIIKTIKFFLYFGKNLPFFLFDFVNEIVVERIRIIIKIKIHKIIKFLNFLLFLKHGFFSSDSNLL